MSFHRIKLKLLLIKLLFLHFGRYLQIGTMDFRTAYMIRKHLDGILFSDIIVEVSAASLEKLRMKVYSFLLQYFWNKITNFIPNYSFLKFFPMFSNVLVLGIKCRNVFPIFSSLERGLAKFFSDKRNIFSVGTGHLFPKNSSAYRARPP